MGESTQTEGRVATERARRTAEATRIPAHGHGRLMPLWPPGYTPNPGRKHMSFKEIRQYCREKSLPAARALAAIVEDVDEKGLPRWDGRIVVVAAQTLLTWAHGNPPPYDPRDDKPPLRVDLSSLSLVQQKHLLALIRQTTTVDEEELASPEEPATTAPAPALEARAEPIPSVAPEPKRKPGRRSAPASVAPQPKRKAKPKRKKKMGRPRKPGSWRKETVKALKAAKAAPQEPVAPPAPETRASRLGLF